MRVTFFVIDELRHADGPTGAGLVFDYHALDLAGRLQRFAEGARYGIKAAARVGRRHDLELLYLGLGDKRGDRQQAAYEQFRQFHCVISGVLHIVVYAEVASAGAWLLTLCVPCGLTLPAVQVTPPQVGRANYRVAKLSTSFQRGKQFQCRQPVHLA
ncbi:hypothetical protein D3C85_1485350 [compost metagenome]